MGWGNLLRAYNTPTNVNHTMAKRLAESLRSQTKLTTRGVDRGLLRWNGSGLVVSEEAAHLAYAIGIQVHIGRCRRIRLNEEMLNAPPPKQDKRTPKKSLV